MSEVENNFFAYEEEKEYSNNADGSIGILYTTHNNVVHDQAYYMNIINNVSKVNDLVGNNAADNAETRLFVFENLFEKIKMTIVMPYTLKKYRSIIGNSGTISNSDLFSTYFSEASNYNVIPYFNSVKIFANSSVEKEVYSNRLPIVYSIASIVNEATATSIANSLKLSGPYSVVSNNDVKNYVTTNNINRNIKFNITTDDKNKLIHKKLYIKNSSNDIIREVVLDNNTVTVENVPVGLYYVDISNGTVDNLNYLLVSQNDSLLISNINYTLTDEDDSIISIGGQENSNNNQESNNTQTNEQNSNSESSSSNNQPINNNSDTSTVIVNLNYEYDPKNVDDLGVEIDVPDTGVNSSLFIMVGMAFIGIGIAILLYKKDIIKRRI